MLSEILIITSLMTLTLPYIHTVGKRKYNGPLQSTAVKDIDHACVSYATKHDDLKTMLSKREVREEAQRILRLMWIAQSFIYP